MSARKISAADDRDPDGDDGDPDRRRGERGERDACRDAATHHARRRPVADPADGGHVSRRVGIVAKFVAQPADMDVDGPVEDLGLVRTVDRIEELVAGEDAAARLDQGHRVGGTRRG